MKTIAHVDVTWTEWLIGFLPRGLLLFSAVAALALSYSLGLMGILTPYATGSAPLYYGSGYLSHRDFWTLGLVFGALYLAMILVVELPWLVLLYR